MRRFPPCDARRVASADGADHDALLRSITAAVFETNLTNTTEREVSAFLDELFRVVESKPKAQRLSAVRFLERFLAFGLEFTFVPLLWRSPWDVTRT